MPSPNSSPAVSLAQTMRQAAAPSEDTKVWLLMAALVAGALLLAYPSGRRRS